MSNRTQKRRAGDRGERRAALWLVLRGWRILERNYSFGRKEIDIIAKRGRVIAFVEVKSRANAVADPPKNAVSYTKQRNIISAARGFCMEHDVSGAMLRFDVAEVPVRGRVNYIPNAFTE